MVRLLLLTCLCLTIGGFATAFGSASHNLRWLLKGLNRKFVASTKNESTICETEQCRLMAQVIKEGMDDSINPCDDFYEYACGNWPNNHPIPEGYDSWSLWHTVQMNVENQIKKTLEAEIHTSDLVPVKLAKKWFKTCINRDAMDKSGLESVLLTLARNGGWPLIMDKDEWAEELYRWQQIDDNYARLTAQSAFFDIMVISLEEDTEPLIVLNSPNFPPRTYKLFNGARHYNPDDESNEDNDDEGSEEKGSSSDENDSKFNHNRKPVSKFRNQIAKKVLKNQNTRKNAVQKKNVGHPEESKTKKYKKHSTKRRTKRGTHIHRTIDRKRHPKTLYKPHQSKNMNKILTKVWKMKHANAHITKTHSKGKAAESKEEDTAEDDDDEKDKSDSENDNDNESTTESSDADDNESDEDSDEVEAKEQREKYAEYILKIALTLAEAKGSDISREKLEQDIEKMIEFQVNLYELSLRDSDYENATLQEVQEIYDTVEPQTANGQVNWMEKVQHRFMEAGVVLDADKELIIPMVQYLNGLRTLLDETPTETIVNYVHWNTLSHLIHGTTKEIRELSLNWTSRSMDSESDWEEMCVRQVQMSDIVGYEYVRQYFSDDILKTAIDMIDEIQKEVEYQVKESTWIDEDTKDFILDKLVNMKKLVGYPDWYRNKTIVTKFYRGLIVGTSYIENMINYMRYSKWKEMRVMLQEIDFDTWFVDPVTLNAFFMPTENSITLTAADFQFPLFAFERPQGINFGIIGFVMAHEVNHGFDNDGHLYNKNGDVMEWLTAMAEAYNRRAECFVDQFNGYSVVKGENATIEDYGNQTAGENIADTMGLQAVYRAYKRRERECGKPDPALPGLQHLTNDQVFFLSFANLWCEVADPEDIKIEARFDEHSTGRLRVIGSVSNSEDFAKAYNCPTGSPMNPEKKCNIWK